ncbi:hypothetical protein Bhyg_09662, partial [Pseudolycoriella hygida]
NNLNYAICIKRLPEFCTIQYTNTVDDIELQFQLINVDMGCLKMGSEQSQASNSIPLNASTSSSRLYRGNTIAVTGQPNQIDDGSPSFLPDSSPPISVCSDSDLPYISYTDNPIGDSPKFRNKGNTLMRSARHNSLESSKKSAVASKRIVSTHNIVVVRAANKEAGMERDPEIQRLQVKYKNLSN